MPILAIDTVTRAGSLALLIGDTSYGYVGDGARTHAQRLPGEALELLARHGCSLEDIEPFVVIAGPGSFTGLRVGMAVVQGLAIVRARMVVAVPTLEAMVEGWRLARAPIALVGRDATVLACLDGQRGDVFCGAWRMQADQPTDESVVVIEPTVVSPEALMKLAENLARTSAVIVVQCGMERHLEMHAHLLDLEGVSVEGMSMSLAEAAARIASRRPDRAVRPHALRPLYIRRPDHELARERAGLTRS